MLNAFPAPADGARVRPRGLDASARHVLVLSGDVLPFAGLPTTGAGLRAWGIAHGLASVGHAVTMLMPRHVIERLPLSDERHAELQPWTFDVEDVDEAVTRWRPDIIVIQHWWMANLITPGDHFLVADLHGPLMLETLYQNLSHYADLAANKLTALSRSDFITCAGHEQRKYFYGWLIMAGMDLRDDLIAAVPVSLSPDLPPHRAEGEVAFVYGGIYLPWQNPLVGLSALIERLEAHGRGRLHFYGGAHPVLKIPSGDLNAIERQIAGSERVTIHGLVPRDQLLAAYSTAHVAFDLMERNPERELAFTTRTVEYLWCGLPVVYNDYAELAPMIREYEAGWTVDPVDRRAIGAVVDAILADPAEVERRGRNAQRLARERLAWDRTIAPLDAFCRNPRKRRARLIHLNRPVAPPEPAPAPAPLAMLLDQVEMLALQERQGATVLEELARARQATPARAVDRAKVVAKRAMGVDRRLVLADHAATLAGDFTGGATHGQSFRRGEGALLAIDVLFATFGRLNASRLRFHLCAVTPAGYGPDLATIEVAAASLRDNRFYRFVFPPLPPAPGEQLAFWLESPDATPTTTVAVWQHGPDLAIDGRRSHNGRTVPGQLVCRLHERPLPAEADGATTAGADTPDADGR